jgi:hypothetical protein
LNSREEALVVQFAQKPQATAEVLPSHWGIHLEPQWIFLTLFDTDTLQFRRQAHESLGHPGRSYSFILGGVPFKININLYFSSGALANNFA